ETTNQAVTMPALYLKNRSERLKLSRASLARARKFNAVFSASDFKRVPSGPPRGSSARSFRAALITLAGGPALAEARCGARAAGAGDSGFIHQSLGLSAVRWLPGDALEARSGYNLLPIPTQAPHGLALGDDLIAHRFRQPVPILGLKLR